MDESSIGQEALRPSEEHVRRQRRRAAYAVAATAGFALAVMAFVVLIGRMAPGAAPDPVPSSPPEGSSSPDVVNPTLDSPFYVLLIGSDTRKGTALYTGKANEQGQQDQFADIMTLMRVDPQTYTITLVSVPRDTVVPDGTVKINDSLVGGDPTLVVDAVESLTGVRADYYIMTTFAWFEDFINAIGGIDVDVPQTVTVVDPMTVEKVRVEAGEDRHLNGAEALVLARARKEYATDQDALRQVNVRAIERAIITKILGLGSDLDVTEAVSALYDGIQTDLDMQEASALVSDFVRNRARVTFYEATGPFEGAERAGDGLWVVPADQASWERIMALVDAGFDPSGVVVAPSFEGENPQEAAQEASEGGSADVGRGA